jgi:hypothetical protein
MGGRKFSLGVERKKGRHQKRVATALKLSIPVKCVVSLPPLSVTVSLPSAVYFDAPVADEESLRKRITLFPLPPTWVINGNELPITLCKLRTYQLPSKCPRVDVLLTLCITSELKWEVTFLESKIIQENCSLLKELPTTISNVSCLGDFMSLVDSSNVCAGNPDADIVQMWLQRFMDIMVFYRIVQGLLITFHPLMSQYAISKYAISTASS